MKELKYETKDGICITPCPYGLNNGFAPGAYIGSLACAMCPANIDKDDKRFLLICNGDEILKNKPTDKDIKLNNEIIMQVLNDIF